jgi:hypothetical protein
MLAEKQIDTVDVAMRSLGMLYRHCIPLDSYEKKKRRRLKQWTTCAKKSSLIQWSKILDTNTSRQPSETRINSKTLEPVPAKTTDLHSTLRSCGCYRHFLPEFCLLQGLGTKRQHWCNYSNWEPGERLHPVDTCSVLRVAFHSPKKLNMPASVSLTPS